MSLLISGDLRLAQTHTRPDDADAVAYIAAVEAADGQALETATRMAINSFVKGCKADGIWPAIKASRILSGARTLSGALVPLVGAAPTNNGFVAGDYDRKTGLKGDGSTKSLGAGRRNSADPRNNKHLSVWKSENPSPGSVGGLIGQPWTSGMSGLYMSASSYTAWNNDESNSWSLARSTAPGATFFGSSRNNSSSFNVRIGSVNYLQNAPSETPNDNYLSIFRWHYSWSSARLAFYSIGESLDLALLDTRVTDLINAFAAAIP
jgi:hypothetical protein